MTCLAETPWLEMAYPMVRFPVLVPAGYRSRVEAGLEDQYGGFIVEVLRWSARPTISLDKDSGVPG